MINNNKEKPHVMQNKVSERLAMFEKKKTENNMSTQENIANKPGKLKPNIFTQGKNY